MYRYTTSGLIFSWNNFFINRVCAHGVSSIQARISSSIINISLTIPHCAPLVLRKEPPLSSCIFQWTMNMVHYLILHMQISDNDILFETIVCIYIAIHRLSLSLPPPQQCTYICMWLYAKMQIIYTIVWQSLITMQSYQWIKSIQHMYIHVLSNQVERKSKIVLRIK